MSTNYNRRRGAAATKPRNVRLCQVYVGTVPCGNAVSADRNGNDCGEHRK